QSNSSIIYGNHFILKLFRKVEPGINPDYEIGRFLTEQTDFEAIAPVAGALTFETDGSEPMSVGILHGYIPNEGDAWEYTLDVLGGYAERVLAEPEAFAALEAPSGHPLDLIDRDLPDDAYE